MITLCLNKIILQYKKLSQLTELLEKEDNRESSSLPKGVF